MGLLGQFWLLMLKNLKLRLRAPALTLTQLLWPALLFIVIALVRTRFQPESKPNCAYDAKAMPSQGLVPFMQSFMCDLGTTCKDPESISPNGSGLPAYHSQARLAQIANSLSPIVNNTSTIESLKNLPQVIKPLAELTNGLNSESLKNFTERKYLVSDFFRNVSDVRQYLKEEAGLDGSVVDSLLHAQLDVYQLLELTGFIDFKGIVCNITRLQDVLTFPPEADVNGVSQALCKVQDDQISIIIDKLQTQLDVPYLINEFSEFLKVLGQTDWSVILDNAGSLLDQLQNIGNLGNLVEGLPNLLEIVRAALALVNQFEMGTLERQLEIVVQLVESIDNAQLIDAMWWTDVKNVISKGHDLFNVVTKYLSYFNDNVIPIKDLFRNETTIRHLLEKQYGVTIDDIKAILQLQLKPDKIPELLQLLMSTSHPSELFCSPAALNISEYLTLPGDSSFNIGALQEALCKPVANGNKVLDVLFNNTDILLFVDQVSQVLKSPPSPIQWDALLDDILVIVASIQDMPEFLQSLPALLSDYSGLFDQSSLLQNSWIQLLAGTIQGNMTVEETLQYWSGEPFVSIIQGVLSQTPAWQDIKYQLITQNMALDIQLRILDMFTGGFCPEGWHSNLTSCYKYVHEVTRNMSGALIGCRELHRRGHLVTVNHQTEQKFLESIGEGDLSWLGLISYGPDYSYWIDGTYVIYENWFPMVGTTAQPPVSVPGPTCGKANFGTDGLWHHTDCDMPAGSYICEAVQDHKLVQLLREDPMSKVTRMLLDLGPHVTEAIFRSFINASFIEALVQMPPSEQARALCLIDLSSLPPSVDVAMVRQTLCNLNVTEILAEQMHYWQVPALQQQIMDYITLLTAGPFNISPAYSHYANLSALVHNYNRLNEAWADVFARPVDLQTILEWYGNVGNQTKEWEDMIERVWKSLAGPNMPSSANASLADLLDMLNIQLEQILSQLEPALNSSMDWSVVKELIAIGQSFLISLPGDEASLNHLFQNESLLLEFLSNQLNQSAEEIQRLYQAFAKLANPSAGTDEWERLLEELLRLTSDIQDLPSLFQRLPELLGIVQRPLNFSGEWTGLAGLIQGNMTVAEFLQHQSTVDLLEALDMQFGMPSPMWWTTIKDIILRGESVLSSLLAQVDKYQGPLTIGKLFRSDSAFRDFFQNQLNLTQADVELLRKTSIDMDKMVELLLHLAVNQQNPADLFCTGNQNLLDYLLVPDNASSVAGLAGSLQTALCHLSNGSSNADAFLRTLLAELDLTMLSDELSAVVGRPVGTIDDWGLLLQKVANISVDIQNLPSFVNQLPSLLNIFQRPLNFAGDWSGIISWLSDDQTFLEAMQQFYYGMYPQLFQNYLSMTEFWPAIQQQLIIQNLAMDLQIALLQPFIGGTCRAGWQGEHTTCFRYVNESSDWYSAYLRCDALHPRSQLAYITDEWEQRYLESIGRDELSWILQGSFFGLSYENWAPGSQFADFYCGAANFGTDGLWQQLDCSANLSSLICQMPQDHILVKLLKEQPFVNATRTLLDLGPNVTEAVIRSLLNATKLQMLLDVNLEDHSTLLCSEGFVDLQPSDAWVRPKLCSLDPWTLLQEQSSFWNVPEIQAAFERLQAFLSHPNMTAIPPEYVPYANISAYFIKNRQFQLILDDAIWRPFDPELLWTDPSITVTGSGAEWQAMSTRIQALLNQKQLEMLLETATGSGTSMMNMEALQYNNAVLQLANTVLNATNELIGIAITFGHRQASSIILPELQRFLLGVMGLIDDGPELLGALSATWNDPSKYSDLIGSPDVKALFCDSTLRQTWLNSNGQFVNTTALDEYLCKVNFDLLAEELKYAVYYDEIVAQFNAIQTGDFNTTNLGSVSIADLVHNVEILQHNLQIVLPWTIDAFDERYNLTALATMAEALFNTVLMGFSNVDVINQQNEVDLGKILQFVPGLKMVLDTLDAGGVADLKQVHAYIAFMNQFLDKAKETTCRDGWQRHDQSCYKYMNEWLSYHNASHKCFQQTQSDLLIVGSAAEQTFLENYGPNADVWMDTYPPFTYQNFAFPNFTEYTGCKKANFGGDGLWYPAPCTDMHTYICEAVPELNLTLGLLRPLTNDSSINRIIDALEQTLSAETVNAILASPIDPFQLSSVVAGADWRKAVCDIDSLRALFMSPDSFNVTQLSEVLCGDAFMETLVALTNNTHVLEQLLNDIASLQASEFNSSAFIRDAQTFLRHMASLSKYKVNSYLPLMSNPFAEYTGFNQSAWQQAWSVETLLSSLDNIDMGLINQSWYRDVTKEIRSVAYFTEYFADRILVLQGKHLVFPEIRNLLANISEIERAFEVVTGFSPELIDALMSLVVKQDKLQEFLSFPNPLAVLCTAGNFSSYFVLPANSNTDLAALENAVCSVDLLKVQMEFLQVVPIDTFMNQFMAYVDTSPSDNLSAIAQRFIVLYEKTQAFIADPFTVNINETWLNDTFHEVVQVLQVWGMNQAQMNPNDINSVVPALQQLDAQFMNESWWNDIKGPLKELTSILDYANMKLAPLPGGNFTFFDILPATTADLLQRLMEDFPEIVGALSQSYVNVTKLETLTGANDLVNLLCDNSTGMTELIEFLPGVNTTAINSVLCSLDYVLLASEWTQELVFFEERRNLPLNWTASYDSAMSLVQTLINLVQSPPNLLMYDADWFSAKLRQTEAILASLYPASSDISGDELDNLLLFIDSALSGRGEFYNSFIMQYRLEDYINRFLIDQIPMFVGQKWTFPSLEGLFADSDNVRSLFVLWDVAPDVVDVFLSLSIRPEMWSVFWETPDPIATLCTNNQFASFFELPQGSPSNLTALQEAVCAVNFTLVPLELANHFKISQIQADLEQIIINDPSLGPFNWTSWMENRDRLAAIIADLVSMPPEIILDEAWWNTTEPQLQDVINSWLVNLQQMAADNQVNNTLNLLQGLEASLRSAGAWEAVRPYLEIFTLSLESAANQLRQQVQLQMGLANTTAIDYLVNSLSVMPDQLKASLADSAFSVFALADIYNRGWWDFVFCNSSIFDTTYHLPPAVNSTAVQQAMCELNQTEFFSHASGIYNIDVLRLQQQIGVILGQQSGSMANFDWAQLGRYVEEMMALLTELQRIPEVMHGDAIQNVTLLLEALNNQGQQNLLLLIQVLEDIRPYFQDDTIVVQIRDSFYASINLSNALNSNGMQLDALPQLEAILKQLDLWHSVRPYLEFANVILDGINTDLHQGGEAIPAFLYNRTVLDRFLQEALGTASPELALQIVADRFHPISELAYLHLSGNWEERFCSPINYPHPSYYPPNLNETALREELCQLDRVEFFGKLDNITGVDVLSLMRSFFEIANHLPASNDTSANFDWDGVVGKVESIMAALQGILGLPGNHGNVTEAYLLLQELQNGLVTFNQKLLVEVLGRLDIVMNQEGVWSEVQEAVAMTTHIVKLYNQQLELLAASNYTLDGVFKPTAQDFLAQYLAPEHVQALMRASINPIVFNPALLAILTQPQQLASILSNPAVFDPALLGMLTQPQQLTSILCNPAVFNTFILLPPGTDSATIQGALCSQAQTNPTFLTDLVAMFNIDQIQKELESLFMNGTNSRNFTDIDWQQSMQEFERLINNFVGLATRDFLGDFLTQWLAMSVPMENLPHMLMNVTVDYTSACQALTPELLNTTAWQTLIKPSMLSTNLAMEIIQDLVFALPKYQEDFQTLINDMTAVVELLTVFTEVESDILQSGAVVLLDPDQMSRAIDLFHRVVQGEIPRGIVCNEYTLSQVTHGNATHLSKLFCGVEKLLQTHAVQEVLRIVGFENILPKITTLFSADPTNYEPFDCPAFAMNSQNFIMKLWMLPSEYANFFSSFQRPEYFDLFEVLPQILANTTTEDFESLTELYHLLQPLIGPLLDNGFLDNATNIDVLLPYLELIDAYLISQLDQTGFVELSSLWSNASVVREYLAAIAGFSPDIIDAIINNKLNISTLILLQGNVRDELCTNMLFTRLFVFNDTATASEVQTLVCQSLNSTDILEFLQGSLNVTELIQAVSVYFITSSPMDVTLPEYMDQLLEALATLSALDPAILDRFLTDQWPSLTDGLVNTTEIIQLAMSAKDLISIAKSLQPVIDVLRPALGNDSTFQMIEKLLDSLNSLDGLLDLLSKLPDLSLRKLFKDPDDVYEFLVAEVGFSDQAASDLLSASLSLEVAPSLNFTAINTIACDETELTKLITFPKGTNVTGVLQTLCTLDSEQLTVALEGVIERMSIGAVIEELLMYSFKERFGNTTASLGDLSNAAADLNAIQESFQTIMTEFQSLNFSSLAIDEIVDSIMGNAAAQASTSASPLSEMVCGKGVSINPLSADDLSSVARRRKRSDGRSRMKREDQFEKVPGSTPFCSSLYDAIQAGENGRLIWRYIKPILLGKIPYAPNSPAAAKIIKASNFLFEEIATIRDVAAAWLAGSADLNTLIGSSQLSLIKDFVANSYTKEILQDQLGLDADLIASLLDSDLVAISADDLAMIDEMAELVVNLTGCVELNRFIPYRTESFMKAVAQRLSRNNTLFAGVYFSNLQNADSLPPHVQYKIRMDIENTAETNRLKDKDWSAGANNELLNQVYTRGFIILQDIIEKAIIQLQTSNDTAKPGVYLQLMPYPCHVVDRFVERFGYLIPLVMVFVFIGAIGSMTHQLVYEKELGIEELMKAMGLRAGLNLLSWFLNNLILMAIMCALMVLILKVGNILPSSDWSLLFFFLMCFSFSLIMMSFLISTFFQRAHVAAFATVLVFIISYVPYVPYIILERSFGSFHETFLISLISTCAFTLGCNEIAVKEAQTVGVQWNTFGPDFQQFGMFNFNWKCVAMLWDGVIYFLIGWYISSVFPGRNGVPKPWYFIFVPCYWSSCFSCNSDSGSGKNYADGSNNSRVATDPDVEMDPTNVPCGISIVGLTKKYNKKKKAVDDLTLNFYEDQITSFLGRNGAGKTTTISIIMGLFPATKGKVYIYNKDVMRQLHSIRKDLGVCPQHDALYDQLTVREHLEMYGRLRGMSLKDIFQQSEDLIADVDMQDAANEKVCNLSGGMKRKLSVMIAFLGGSNIVILDEPTSGVDPHARRAIWDLISKNKKGRTILLCTHFMDEADLLGDRIAILDHGQLRCCGSSAFLKGRFTSGYTLTIAKELPSNQSTPETMRKLTDGASDPADYNRNTAVDNVYVEMTTLKKPEAAQDHASTSSQDHASTSSSSGVSSFVEPFNCAKVTSFIQSHIPSAVLKEDVGTEVSFTLPVSFGQTAKFQGLFEELDAKLPELHASSYGLSDASLEEVFLNVSSQDEGETDGPKDKTKMVPESTMESVQVSYNMKPSTLHQFLAILTKRFHYTKRDWRGFIWALLLPMLLLLLAVVFGTLSSGETNPQLHFAPSLYRPDDYVFFSNSDSRTADGTKMTNALFSAPGLGTTCMNDFEDGTCHFTEAFFKNPISSLSPAEIEEILAVDRAAPDCSCANSFLECPEGAVGAAPPQWIMNTTDILLDVSLKADLIKYLLRSTEDFRFKRYNGLTLHSKPTGDTQEFIKAWYNNKGFHAMPIALNTANNIILRSYLPPGQDPATYGISAYTHPFEFSGEGLSVRDIWDQTAQNFGNCLIIVLAFCLIPATFATFLVMEYNNGSKRLHYVSGVTPTGYWLANLVWDMLMYLIPIGISLIIVCAFGMHAFSSSSNIPAFCLLLFLYGFATVCQLYVLVPLFKSTGTAFIVYFCLTFLVAILTIIPKFLQESPLGGAIREHDAFYYLDHIFLIFSPFCLASGLIELLYNQAEADIYATFGLNTYRDPFGFNMLGWKFVALAIEGVVAFLLLMIVESSSRRRSGDCKSGSPDHNGVEDEDVAMERQRLVSGDTKNDLVCIQNLTKVYRSVNNSSLVAVDDLCVGIPKGQCFGLLGVNGAGKTTTFRMIINDLAPTHGSIKVRSNSVGYCPQADALYSPLTGTELLYCYARIKGLTGKQCEMAVRRVVHQMNMEPYVNNRIGTYSGGMKRSLSTAIALLGNPQVILMDEPTTGMDPVAKQAVWSNVLALIKNGHSVILTSHSMEECELLCTRLAIMVNGRFQCLGSPQQVKHRHGDGYTLILRINDETLDWSSIMNFVNDRFPEAILKERHHNMVRFQLPLATRRLADIFGAVEENKARLGIQEYSVTQTTLDQVFVNFAKRQTDGHKSGKESVQEFTNQAFTTADEA
ncbi:uncharacterized protein LOC119728778 isoform X2 [Patiria miniata]|uniref:Uncharacterized protein n=1 Tax=Patiria miniata TaxID=46514 RepID=A0A914A163_PATMI|nr:uncharacterized protein LOC119728778 isoform X2 [Patiria miniata]